VILVTFYISFKSVTMASKQPTTEKDEMASAISNLSIDTPKATTPSQTKPKPKKAKKKNEPIADSWEDEDVSDEEPAQDKHDNQQEDAKEPPASSSSSTPSSSSSLTTPAVPPPTPASPLALDASYEWAALATATTTTAANQGQGSSPGGGTPARRPEKTDAVARRMIAAGLGLKAPRQTEEQRAYQRSVREQEKKRREAQRAEEERLREAAERAKAAVWED
jgi:hypothetical protein